MRVVFFHYLAYNDPMKSSKKPTKNNGKDQKQNPFKQDNRAPGKTQKIIKPNIRGR